MLEPDRYYDAIAADYARQSRNRERYLRAVDEMVTAHAPPAARMLDVGSGDGIRARSLANRIQARTLTLLDSSREMHARCATIDGACAVHADIADPELPVDGQFDLITCLWNVLGHVGEESRRRRALVNLARLLAPGGALIIDVNNRWNVRVYGWRAVRNLFYGSGELRGNFKLVAPEPGAVDTVVHLFAPGELERRFAAMSLRTLRRQAIDYADGRHRRSSLCGQLVYVLSRD